MDRHASAPEKLRAATRCATRPRRGTPGVRIRNSRGPRARSVEQRGTGIDSTRLGADMMSIRAAALVGVLQHELAWLGRFHVAITLGADERSVTLADDDGQWLSRACLINLC